MGMTQSAVRQIVFSVLTVPCDNIGTLCPVLPFSASPFSHMFIEDRNTHFLGLRMKADILFIFKDNGRNLL